MQVMQPRTKKGPSWANEASQPRSEVIPSSTVNVHPSRVKLVENAVDGEEEEKKEDGDVEREEGISDLDWMKGRMTQNIEASDKPFEQSEDEIDHKPDAEEAFKEVRMLCYCH